MRFCLSAEVQNPWQSGNKFVDCGYHKPSFQNFPEFQVQIFCVCKLNIKASAAILPEVMAALIEPWSK